MANAERTSRGLAPVRQSVTLDAMAAAGAAHAVDPTGPANLRWGGNIASDYATPLAADFAWMYDDGPGGTNGTCTSAGDPGCWGHRDNILAPSATAVGSGVATVDGIIRLTQLFVAGY